MSQKEKLIKKMQSKPTPKIVDFDDYKTYVEYFGFYLSTTKGSHNKFKHETLDITLIVPTISGRYVRAAYIDEANLYIRDMEEE